jgi:hypothetical protein
MKNGRSDLANSRALFVLKIITMSFAILACIVVATAMLTRWIMDLNRKIKESNSKIARASARIEKFRKGRIKHILKQRKLQLKEEKSKKRGKNKRMASIEADGLDELEDLDELGDLDDEMTDDEDAMNGFDDDGFGDISIEDDEIEI